MEGAELALGNLTEGAGIKEQLEQCLCVLVNLSGGGSRIKDALTGDEKLVKILCSVLVSQITITSKYTFLHSLILTRYWLCLKSY